MISAKEIIGRKLDFTKINKIVDGDEDYRVELLELTLRFFTDIKQNYKIYLLNHQADKLKYLAHKAKPSLSLFDSSYISQLLAQANALVNQPFEAINAELLIQAMELECDFFISEISQQLQ
jgi:hypothetical protein